MTAVSRYYAPRGDSVQTAYLGYALEVTNRDVTVRDKTGRKLVTVASIGAARRFLRGYRRDVPVKAEPANVPVKVLVGSDNQGA